MDIAGGGPARGRLLGLTSSSLYLGFRLNEYIDVPLFRVMAI